MEQNFNTSDDNSDDYSHKGITDKATLSILDQFFKRGNILQDALQPALSFLEKLDYVPNITRFIYHNPYPGNGWRPSQELSRRQRAQDVIDELKIMYIHLHWRKSQAFSRFNDPILSRWESFVVIAAVPTYKVHLVECLLKRAAEVKESAHTGVVPDVGIPFRFIDPLSGEVFTDPVKASDGHIYERHKIEAWRETYKTSPLDPTVKMDRESALIPDTNLSRQIMAYLGGRPRHMLRNPRAPFLLRFADGDYDGERAYVTLPESPCSAFAVLFDEWTFTRRKPSASLLWHNLRDSGDGMRVGRALQPDDSLLSLKRSERNLVPGLSLGILDLEHGDWQYFPSHNERIRKESRNLSRLDVVKQAFEAFVNKSEAYDHPVAIGLVTFGKQVREVQGITLLKEQFRETLKSVEADGDTPLFDSLGVAHDMLQRFKREHPSATLRVICLTDGQDVGSKTKAHKVAAKLQRAGIIMDSMVLQTGAMMNVLHPISVVTGGYSFKVDTLENALNIVELEPMLRAKDRVERPPKPIVVHPWQLYRYNILSNFALDVVTSESCPNRKPHARINEPLLSAQKAAGRRAPPSSTDRQRRLMQEIRDIVNSPHPFIDVYTGDDLAFWKIVIEAPHGSPYDGGTFLAYIDFGEKYPQVAPEVRFITPILHPNINRHGKFCHAALDRSWLVDMTMNVVLQILYGILLTPDTDSPLDLHATMEYNDDSGQHALKVHDMVKKFASKNRQEWRSELEGGLNQ